jgi:hypothetical protein
LFVIASCVGCWKDVPLLAGWCPLEYGFQLAARADALCERCKQMGSGDLSSDGYTD